MESDIMKSIQMAMSSRGHRVFRNNVGKLKDGRGQWVTFGLCEGSSDLIGWTKDGRFLAIEVKAPGARTKPERLAKQTAFIATIKSFGGVAFFAESVEQAVTQVEAVA